MSIRLQWCGGDPEHVLFLYPFKQVLGTGIEECAHAKNCLQLSATVVELINEDTNPISPKGNALGNFECPQMSQ